MDIHLYDTIIVPKKWTWFNGNLIDSAYALILFVYDTSPSLKLETALKPFSTDFYLLSVLYAQH